MLTPRCACLPQVFDYANVLDDSVGIHYPVHEIPSRVKLSCCTWNSYMKSNLIVSDYEGTVTLHDVAVGSEVRVVGIQLLCTRLGSQGSHSVAVPDLMVSMYAETSHCISVQSVSARH